MPACSSGGGGKKTVFTVALSSFPFLKKMKQCWPLLFRHLFQTAADKTSRFLCNVGHAASWLSLHWRQRCDDAGAGNMQKANKRQPRRENTLWQEGEKSFAEWGIQPISGGRGWLMRSLIRKNNSFCISSSSSSQAFATKATHVWNFHLKWCF